MQETKTYRWINMRVDDEKYQEIKKAAEHEYLPIASFAKKTVFDAAKRINAENQTESIR